MMWPEPRYRTALAWQIALAAYMQLVTWVPLGRWNYQPCCPTGLQQLQRGMLTIPDALGAFAFALPLMFFWIGAVRHWRWVMWLSVVAVTVWLGLQVFTWWPPYIFGASERWMAVYARAFAEATPILPRWGNHLPPDAMHFFLQVFLGGSVASGIVALWPASE